MLGLPSMRLKNLSVVLEDIRILQGDDANTCLIHNIPSRFCGDTP
jgi:hypothetical protein